MQSGNRKSPTTRARFLDCFASLAMTMRGHRVGTARVVAPSPLVGEGMDGIANKKNG
jgi:hypothetical protein